jgi:hypothetical protein
MLATVSDVKYCGLIVRIRAIRFSFVGCLFSDESARRSEYDGRVGAVGAAFRYLGIGARFAGADTVLWRYSAFGTEPWLWEDFSECQGCVVAAAADARAGVGVARCGFHGE